MSGGVLFQEALRTIRRFELPELSERDLLIALEAGRPGPLDLLYAAGLDAALSRPVLLKRGAALFFSFCAGNVADDLIDGDCDYFTEPLRIGPCVQFALQNLFFATCAEAELPPSALAETARALVRAAGPQALEVRTVDWTAPLYRQVAQGIAGEQWAAYLGLLWFGTPLQERAAQLGRDLGFSGHVVEDIRSQDRRFFSMPEADQALIRQEAKASASRLRHPKLQCLEAVLPSLTAILGVIS